MPVCLDDDGNPLDYDAAVALMSSPASLKGDRIKWGPHAQDIPETKDEYIKAYGFSAPMMPRDPFARRKGLGELEFRFPGECQHESGNPIGLLPRPAGWVTKGWDGARSICGGQALGLASHRAPWKR